MQILLRLSLLIAIVFCLMGAAKREFLSREEYTQIMKDNDFLCYKLVTNGSCEWIEYVVEYKDEGLDIYFVYVDTNNDTILIENRPLKWTGDRLCHIPGKIVTAVLSSNETRFSFPHDERYLNQKPKTVVEFNEWYGDEFDKSCFAYQKTDNKKHFLQVTYVDGVEQKGIDIVTTFNNHKKPIRIRK